MGWVRLGMRAWLSLLVACGGASEQSIDAGSDDVRAVPWFEDITAASRMDFERMVGTPWVIADMLSGGVCVLDVDGSPPLDVFFAVRQPSHSRLYVGSGAPEYANETADRGLSEVGDAIACLAYDEDGDGDDDLLVLGVGNAQLFRNDDGHFTDASRFLGLTVEPQTMLTGADAGDVDGDGDLDLLIGAMFHFDPEALEGMDCGPVPCASVLTSFTPLPNVLLARQPDGTYLDVTADLAPGLTEAHPTLVTAIHDLDQDGVPELFEGNDMGLVYPDRVFRLGADGVFAEVGDELGLARDRNGTGVDSMGWASGDVDGDGHLDHVKSDSEGRGTAIFSWRPAMNAYVDTASDAQTGAAALSFRWGLALADMDLDGDDDIVEATGHLFARPESLEIGYRGDLEQRPNLYVNDGTGTFDLAAAVEGDGLAVTRVARGLALIDFDEDGRPDVVMAPARGRPLVLKNRREPQGHWLRVYLRGAPPNTPAAGSVVRVRAGARTWIREKRIAYGIFGNPDPRLFFGLGDATEVDIEVRWPSGETVSMTGVSVDREVRITQ